MWYRVIHTLLWLLLAALSVCAQSQPRVPVEGEQVLFLIDDSSSMTSPAFAPPDTAVSRWDVVRSNFPDWLGRLGSKTQVGAVSVGGDCGAPPSINLPVGASRSQLLSVVSAAHPQGDTNLNAVLKASPTLFDMNVAGGRHIVLFSDGENTCQPVGSTCEIARVLHRDYGIVIDIVAWVTSPKMVDEFKCVSEATGGQFTTPQSHREWTNIPLPAFDPWRYVVLALSVLMLLFAAAIFYRHAYHILGWDTGLATVGGGLLLSVGTLIVYITLFARAEIIAALLGLVVAGSILAVAARTSSRPHTGQGASSPLWPSICLAVVVLSGAASATYAGETPLQCKKIVQGSPRFHHILAIDASGSVVHDIEQMKALLSCYGEMYTLPNEEITLIAFGLDDFGTAKELRSFTVPDSGSTQILDQLLEDMKIQDPRRTRTYFRPLADVLNQFLAGVRMDPVVLVVSDGKSDGYLDAEKGVVNFKEVSFESFGTRGIYSAPGMRNWKVAVQGGGGLDLTALFQHPLVTAGKAQSAARPLGAVIEPCLIDPQLIVRTDNVVALEPGWNPFSHNLEGDFAINVKNDCAARFRSFKVELLLGGQRHQLGAVANTLINGEPRAFTFKVSLPNSGDGPRDGVVQVVLEQGSGVRTIYPQSPATVTIEQISYLSAHGLPLALTLVACLVFAGTAIYLMRTKLAKEQNRPEIVKVMGGCGIALVRNQPISIGGDGCGISVPGVPVGTVLAVAEWMGIRGEINIQPSRGLHIKVRGVEIEGGSIYKLGQPLQFVDKESGVTHDVTLTSATSKDIGFSSSLTAGPSVPQFDGGFPNIGDVISSDGFGAISPPQQPNSNGNVIDTYI